MGDGESVSAGSVIISCHMVDTVCDSDIVDCATSLASLMDLVDIIKVTSYNITTVKQFQSR